MEGVGERNEFGETNKRSDLWDNPRDYWFRIITLLTNNCPISSEQTYYEVGLDSVLHSLLAYTIKQENAELRREEFFNLLCGVHGIDFRKIKAKSRSKHGVKSKKLYKSNAEFEAKLKSMGLEVN